ncbi:hypothetical protein JTE90_007025 [Oedothorax gibbosus]|uniref:Uncharacterized protein n=1 Tax=Oedothorax gibbosus TaxID=931172 RepID=A0AAV6U8D7_9ARAC|nr:hypothetical protein JTE90_007025 [Oedothorax gibbosus]
MPLYNGVIGIEQSFRSPVLGPKICRTGRNVRVVMSEHPFASSLLQPHTYCWGRVSLPARLLVYLLMLSGLDDILWDLVVEVLRNLSHPPPPFPITHCLNEVLFQ